VNFLNSKQFQCKSGLGSPSLFPFSVRNQLRSDRRHLVGDNERNFEFAFDTLDLHIGMAEHQDIARRTMIDQVASLQY